MCLYINKGGKRNQKRVKDKNKVVAKPGEEADTISMLLKKRIFRLQKAEKSILEMIPQNLGLGEWEAIA